MLLLVFQCGVAFFLLVTIYMVFAIFDSEFGFDGLFALVIQFLFAIVIAIFTILLCLLIGLPIRLHPKIKNWWMKNFYVSIFGVMVGLALLGLSYLPQLTETVAANINGIDTTKKIPNVNLAVTGWFVTAFMVLHIYPPAVISIKIKNAVLSKNGL